MRLTIQVLELTHWKRLWCWEGLGAGGEGDDRGWDGWMVSQTRWTWVWVNSGRWWWTGRPGVLRFVGSQRVGHDWATELNWCWSWNSNTLASLWEEWTIWKRPRCWERLEVGGEGDDRGWDRWMASPTLWIWVWVSSGSWWWTGKPGVLFEVAKSQTQLSDWTELTFFSLIVT